MERPKSGKILLVEDDVDTCTVLSLLFQLEGFTVITAADGQEAYLKVCAESPDLIITDINMPKVSGLEFIQSLHQNAALAEIPVIVMSAVGKNHLRQARELGAAATYEKPVEFDQILPLVANLVAAHRQLNHRRFRHEQRNGSARRGNPDKN